MNIDHDDQSSAESLDNVHGRFANHTRLADRSTHSKAASGNDQEAARTAELIDELRLREAARVERILDSVPLQEMFWVEVRGSNAGYVYEGPERPAIRADTTVTHVGYGRSYDGPEGLLILQSGFPDDQTVRFTDATPEARAAAGPQLPDLLRTIQRRLVNLAAVAVASAAQLLEFTERA